MINPALRLRGQDILVILFSGAAVTAPGVVQNAETSAGEASQPFGDFGPIAFIDFAGDPMQVEFIEYTEPGTGARLLRRVTKRERVGTIFPVVKCSMSSESTVIAQQADFDRRDFNPGQFATD